MEGIVLELWKEYGSPVAAMLILFGVGHAVWLLKKLVKTSEKMTGMVQDHEVRLSVVESEVDNFRCAPALRRH